MKRLSLVILTVIVSFVWLSDAWSASPRNNFRSFRNLNHSVRTNIRKAFRPHLVIRSRYAKAMRSVVFSPDGHWFASGGDSKTVQIWNARTGQQAAVLKGHSNPIQSMLFLPDRMFGKLPRVRAREGMVPLERIFLASGDTRGNVLIWRLDSQEILKKSTQETEVFRQWRSAKDLA